MKKKILRSVAVSLCVIVLLGILQVLLMPKYMDESRDGALVGEYYDFAGDNDVVFVGDCEVYENFSPITLWQEYGIPSAIRGSPQQMIWQSYYLMEETFRYETPKVMVFNVLSMKYGSNESTGDQTRREAYNRMALDGMRWSSAKWNSIQASMTEEERQWEGEWSYIFPILRYHSRWSELKADDFRYLFAKERISHNGYLMQTGIKPVTAPYVGKPLLDYSFSENSWYWLDKMRELCESHGTQLVLIKAPSLYPVWWDQWDAQIEEYAEVHELLYINFLDYQEDIGIDWNTDTYDAGLHLNVFGAEKLASYFGQILTQQCGLEDRREDAALAESWAEKTRSYETQKEKAREGQ